MRATKHAAPQPWRGRELVMGISLAPLVERLTVGGTAVQPDVARPDVAQPTGVRFARH